MLVYENFESYPEKATLEPPWRVQVSKGSTCRVTREAASPFERGVRSLRMENPTPAKHLANIQIVFGRVDTGRVKLQFEFRVDDGFFLNGKPLKLHGVNRHQDYPGLGNALPPRMQVRDAEMIKEMGGNFVRLSHYPQHPAFLDHDKAPLGMLLLPPRHVVKVKRLAQLVGCMEQTVPRVLRVRLKPHPVNLLPLFFAKELPDVDSIRRLLLAAEPLDGCKLCVLDFVAPQNQEPHIALRARPGDRGDIAACRPDIVDAYCLLSSHFLLALLVFPCSSGM